MYSFSPGEVIFFGEHSVVYGRTAIAAAISRGLSVSGTATQTGQIDIYSNLGRLKADLKTLKVLDLDGDASLQSLLPLFGRFEKKIGVMSGVSVNISSEIPEKSGLASSAASSSALLNLLLHLYSVKMEKSELVNWVYESEIDIQKRGSVIGSATTVNGGFLRVKSGKWETLPLMIQNFPLLVIDTFDRCSTSVTTGIVKEKLDKDPRGTEILFDEMDQIAQSGFNFLKEGQFDQVGLKMSENQTYLRRLGVSTPKIDKLLESLSPYIFGGKITGAGGGGCVVCLPRDKEVDDRVSEIVSRMECRLLNASIQYEGVSMLEEGVVS